MPSIFKAASKRDWARSLGQGSEAECDRPVPDVDEFGAQAQSDMVAGREGQAHIKRPHGLPTPPTSPSRQFTIHPADRPPSQDAPPLLPPKYAFLPTSLPRPTGSDNSIDSFHYSTDDVTGLRAYGLLGGVGAHVVLGLEEVTRLVKVVGGVLEERGLVTPLLFSALRVGVEKGGLRGLVQGYLDGLSATSAHRSGSHAHSHSARLDSFAEDMRYVKEHELAWFLRWALSRVTRVSEGTKKVVHGVIEYEVYEEWRGRERSANYPSDAFPYLSALLPSPAYTLLLPLFHLLSRFAAHSHLSGLAPHALSSLFAPLLFSVPLSAPALVAHATFVRAAAATEHLLLAYIRSTSRTADLGLSNLPGRLKEWVAGYPRMIATDADLAAGRPRRGARVVRCERATRWVRAYSRDLIMTAETWMGEGATGETRTGSTAGGAARHGADTGTSSPAPEWPVWERVVWRNKRGDDARPKFAPNYRKKMAVKETPILPTSSAYASGARRGANETSGGDTLAAGGRGRGEGVHEEGRRSEEEDGKWGSLAGREWSIFEEGGFGAVQSGLGAGAGVGGCDDLREKLRFDLTESAKMSIAERRKTMDWTEFASASGGFTRADPALSSTLSFSPPINRSIEQWPRERAELQKRLHKSQKESVRFGWDVRPRFGAESGWAGGSITSPGGREEDKEGERDGQGRVYLEEAFVDAWADLGMGAGWVDRAEMTFRECNWAIIEYKARPKDVQVVHPRDETRTGTLYFLFEEKVPLEYQLSIANPQEKKSFSLFHRKKKPAGISNSASAPANLSLLTISASHANAEFDRMLLSKSGTKRLTLSPPGTGPAAQPAAAIYNKQVHTASHTTGSGPPSPVKLISPKPGVGFIVKSRTKAHDGSAEKQVSFQPSARERTESGRSVNANARGKNDTDTNKTSETKSIFFHKGLSLRRRGTDEDLKQSAAAKGRGRKASRGEREMRGVKEDEMVDFELQSASGVGSPSGGSSQEDEKWMDILIANGAKRMDRHDGVESTPTPRHGGHVGLPPSPLPPHRLNSPQPPPAESASEPQRDRQRGKPYHSPDTSGEAEEEVQTPRQSGFSSPDHLYHQLEIAGHQPMPSSTSASGSGFAGAHVHLEPAIESASPVDPSLRHHSQAAHQKIRGGATDSDSAMRPPPPPPKPSGLPRKRGPYADEPSRDSWSSGSDRAGVYAPSPQRYDPRDTIHNIVDTYRDEDLTRSTFPSERDAEGDTGRYSGYTDELAGTEGGSEDGRYASDVEGRVGSSGEYERNLEADEPRITFTGGLSAVGEDLRPPKIAFDLTPTREPSPGRYRHGEPLHFVSEEPENEITSPSSPGRYT